MIRVVVTGASGCLGSFAAAALAAAGAEVHAVSRRAPGPSAPGFRWHAHDLLESGTDDLMATIRPTHLLHAAWDARPGSYDDSGRQHAWVAASERLFRAFGDAGGRRAVGVGTCMEYDWSAGLCRETDPTHTPATAYGVAKAATWSALRRTGAALGFTTAWARVFFIYGPGEPATKLVSALMRSLLDGQPFATSAGDQRRDYLYAGDAGRALAMLTTSDVAGAVNVGSGRAIAVADLARAAAATVGRPELLRIGARTGVTEAPLVVADTARLRGELGWQEEVGLEEGLRRTAGSLAAIPAGR